MIPLALALVGGYFIGDALKKKQVFAEGGDVYFPFGEAYSLSDLKDSGVLSRELDSCSDEKILKIYSDLKSKEYQQKIKQKYQNGKLRVTREQAIDYILKFADGGMMANGGVMAMGGVMAKSGKGFRNKLENMSNEELAEYVKDNYETEDRESEILATIKEDRDTYIEDLVLYQGFQNTYNKKKKYYPAFAEGGVMAKGGVYEEIFYPTKGAVKFRFKVGDTIKVPQYQGGKLKKLFAKIVEAYPAKQSDGTYYPFYYVVGEWSNAGKMLYNEEQIVGYGNKS